MAFPGATPAAEASVPASTPVNNTPSAGAKRDGTTATDGLAFAVTLVGTIISTAGLLVGLYTLWRVKRVARAQVEERRLTQELLGIPELELDIRKVITKLRETQDADSEALASSLSVKLGKIQGVQTALAEHSGTEAPQLAARLESGFFCQEFLVSHIDDAHSNIDIITGRTLLVSGYDVLNRLRRACERGVEVRLIGFSEDAPLETIQDALKTVANPPPKDADAYKQQIADSKRTIIEAVASWAPDAKKRFHYYTNKSVPRVTLVRSDKFVSIGFLQLYRDAQPSELEQRQYVRVLATSALGDVVLRHLDLAIREGAAVTIP